MKKQKVFVLAPVMLIILMSIFSSCKSSRNDENATNQNGNTSNIDDVNFIPKDVTQSLASIMPIYVGSTPPNVEGVYRFNTLTEISHVWGNQQICSKGSFKISAKVFNAFYKLARFCINQAAISNEESEILNDAYLYFKYSGQDNKAHTINSACSFFVDYTLNGTQKQILVIDSIHAKKYIQGSDNKFTTYDEYTYTSKASSKIYKLGVIVSGEKSGNTLRNIRSCFCVENGMTLIDFLGDLLVDTYCALRDLNYIKINTDNISDDYSFLKKYNLNQGDNKALRSIVTDAIQQAKDSLQSDKDISKYYNYAKTVFDGISGLDSISAGNNVLISNMNNDLEIATWPQQTLALVPIRQLTELLDKIGINRTFGYSDDKRTYTIDLKPYTINLDH